MRDLAALVTRLNLKRGASLAVVRSLTVAQESLLAAIPAPEQRTSLQSYTYAQLTELLMIAAVEHDADCAAFSQAQEDLHATQPREPSALECEIDNLQWEIDELLSSIEIDGEKGRRHYVDMHRRRLAELEERLDELRR